MTTSPPAGNRPPDGSVSDESLVRRLRAGSETAADRLYARYVARLRALARAKLSADLAGRVDPDDIVQSVFRRFFQHAAREDYDAPAGEDLWDLLLVITLNKIRSERSFQRAAKRDVRRTRRIDGLDPYTLAKENPHGQTGRTFLRMVAEEALDSLPPLQRRIVELRMEGYQVHEIAQQTGRSLRTVERTLQSCRKQLSALLTDHDPTPAPERDAERDACTVD
jgi:RNA polymerase sigma-70 factor (ECF subfamily)